MPIVRYLTFTAITAISFLALSTASAKLVTPSQTMPPSSSSCACTMEFNLVCSRDGQTFPNACAAKCVGIVNLVSCTDGTPLGPIIKEKRGTLKITGQAFPQTFAIPGQKNVEFLRFTLRAMREDVVVEGLAPEFWASVYGEALDPGLFTNLRMVDTKGMVLLTAKELIPLKEVASDGSWGYTTTYAWLRGNPFIVKKGRSVTIRLMVDIPRETLPTGYHATFPSGTGDPASTFGAGIAAHVEAKGKKSGKKPLVIGEADGEIYLEPAGTSAVALTAMDRFGMKVTIPRHGKDVAFGNFAIAAWGEDVRITRMDFRITNLVAKQFSNVRLRDVQSGAIVGGPLNNLPIVTGAPNMVFRNLSLIIPAGQSRSFEFVADTSAPEQSDRWSDGSPLNHEILSSASLGVTSVDGKVMELSTYGGFSIPLYFVGE